jgi:hypothetical protein
MKKITLAHSDWSPHSRLAAAAALALLCAAAPLSLRGLDAHSAVDPQNGFPATFSDSDGLALRLGLEGDGWSGFGVFAEPDATNAWSVQTGFGSEAYYWVATAMANVRLPNDAPGSASGLAVLTLGLLATYDGDGTPANGLQRVVSRVRVRLDVPVAGDYIVTHPYGVASYSGAARGRRSVDVTRDIGGTAPDFDAALLSEIGPFLRWSGADYPVTNPATGTLHVGNPQILHEVIGSPFAQNVFRIQGPAGSDLDGQGNDFVETRLFSLAGMIASDPEGFTRTLTVAVDSANGGTVAADPAPDANGKYALGATVTLTATPEAGSVFDSWSGAVTGILASATVTMDASKFVTAHFVPVANARHVLALDAQPAGSGTVTAAPAPDLYGRYEAGTTVTLTATPAVGYVFDAWSGAASGAVSQVAVTLDAPKAVTAQFAPARYALTLITAPPGSGSVSVSPLPDADGLYAHGTVVTLTASPAIGYAFTSWNGAASGAGLQTSVTLDAAKTATANFVPRRTLTLSAVPSDGGSVSAAPAPGADGMYAHGTVVTLTATPAAGFAFTSWSGGVPGAGLQTSVTLDADKTATANFAVAPAALSVSPASRAVAQEAGSAAFAVANNGAGTMEWTAQVIDGGAWARIISGASGSQAGSVTVGYDANPVDGAARTATIRVTAAGASGSPVDVSITQDANLTVGLIEAVAIVGVPLEIPLPPAFAVVEQVTAKELPAGVKVDVESRTIKGVPVKPGRFDKGVIAATGVIPHVVEITVEELPVWAQGTFSGVAETPALGSGTASMSVSARGKVAGKIALAGTNYSFSATSYAGLEADGSFLVAATATVAKASLPLTLVVSAPAATAPATLGTATGALAADGAITLFRAVWKDAGMAAALSEYVGYYTATLPGDGTFGSGYLTFTVSAAGGVKTTGKLADGTAVSLSGPLILDEAGRVFAVLYTAPAAYRGGSLFGAAELALADVGPATVRLLDDAPLVWRSRNPQATGDYGEGFDRETGLTGGWYDKLAALEDYFANGLTVGGVGLPELTATVRLTVDNPLAGGIVRSTETRRFDAAEDASPNGLILGFVGAKLVAPKAERPALDEDTETYDYAGNSSALTLSYTRATGLFRGAFKVWYDYASAEDATEVPVGLTMAHVSKPVTFQGALTPVREQGVAEGRGFFLWADKGSFDSGKVDRAGNPVMKPYAFNASYDFLLMAN